MAKNNPGNGYFAVLPNNEETAQVIAYLRKHLSPDRKIRLRGQGQCTNGKSHAYYTHGLPVHAASHVRLYLEQNGEHELSQRERNLKHSVDFYRERMDYHRNRANETAGRLNDIKRTLHEVLSR